MDVYKSVFETQAECVQPFSKQYFKNNHNHNVKARHDPSNCKQIEHVYKSRSRLDKSRFRSCWSTNMCKLEFSKLCVRTTLSQIGQIALFL